MVSSDYGVGCTLLLGQQHGLFFESQNNSNFVECVDKHHVVVASSSDVQPCVIASASHANQQQKSRSSISLCQLILALGFEEKSTVDGAIAMALNTKSCSHLLLPVVCPCTFDKVQF